MVHLQTKSAEADPSQSSRYRDPFMLETMAGPLEVMLLGPEKGEPLVLVTHGLGDWSTLLEIGTGLAERRPNRRIIAFSRPGCGRTPETSYLADPLAYDAFVVLPALLTALSIRRADFIAHSDGAAVALFYAARFGKTVRSMVVIAPYVSAGSSTVRTLKALPHAAEESGFYTPSSTVTDSQQRAYARWRARRIQEGLAGWSILGSMTSMTAPLLIVQGMQDSYSTPEQSNLIAGNTSGPVSWLMLRQADHFPYRDNPEQIVALCESHMETAARKRLAMRRHAIVQSLRPPAPETSASARETLHPR